MRRLALLAFIWGWSFLFIKVAVAGMTPSTVAATRIALGMVILMAVLRAKGLQLPKERTWWRHFTVMAVGGSAVPFTLLAWGEQHVSSALTAVLNASTPLFAALVVAVALGERLRAPQWGGLALGFAGVGVAAGVGGADFAGSSMAGEAAAIAAGACYALSMTYAKVHLVSIPPLVAAAGQLVVATVLMAPVALATTLSDGISLTPRRLAAVTLLGVLGTGFAYVLYYRSIAVLGPTVTSTVTYLVPIVAVTVGVLFLREEFHLRLLAGGALTVLGIALLNRGRGRHEVPLLVDAAAPVAGH